MKNNVLLDTNIVIRFLTKDSAKHYEASKDIFRDIKDGKLKAELLDIIVAEVVYVLHSFYKHSKKDIAFKLKDLFAHNNIYIANKLVVFKALEVFDSKNIDFADAMLCAKKNLEGYEVMSFDKDLNKC